MFIRSFVSPWCRLQFNLTCLFDRAYITFGFLTWELIFLKFFKWKSWNVYPPVSSSYSRQSVKPLWKRNQKLLRLKNKLCSDRLVALKLWPIWLGIIGNLLVRSITKRHRKDHMGVLTFFINWEFGIVWLDKALPVNKHLVNHMSVMQFLINCL